MFRFSVLGSVLASLLLLIGCSCGGGSHLRDGGGELDAGQMDAGGLDAGADAGPPDAGTEPDAGCPDGDGDGVCDEVDICLAGDDALDGDSDSVPDACDQCDGYDDADDVDGDGLPDGCDRCGLGAILAAGPISFWRLGHDADATTAIDSIGGRDGRIVGTLDPVPGVSEDGNLASDFTGDAERVEINPFDGMPPRAFAISLWVRMPSTAQAQHLFSYATNDAGTPRFNALLLREQRELGVGLILGDTLVADTGVRVDDDRYHHILVSRDELELVTIYVDAEVAFEGPMSYSLPRVGSVMFAQDQDSIGGGLDPAQDLEGLLDEIALFDRSLSAAEVGAIYDSGACVLSAAGM